MADRANAASRCLAEAEVYKGLKLYVVTLLVLTCVAWGIFLVRALIQHQIQLDSSLFSAAGHQFSDFTVLSKRAAHFGEPNLLLRTDISPDIYPYPVPSIYVFLFFVRLFANPLAAYLAFVLLSFFVATGCFSWRAKRISPGWLPQVAIWSTLLLGFPLLFLIIRGNIEAVIWVLSLLGIVAYTRNRMLTSAILWALAASMKIIPGLLFVLFLAKRRYRIFVLAIASTIAFSVLALAGLGPTIRQAASDSARTRSLLLNRVSPCVAAAPNSMYRFSGR